MVKKTRIILSVVILISLASCRTSSEMQQQRPTQADFQRTVSVTIDDLPVAGSTRSLEERQEITKNLLDKITKHGVPVEGFVNERKLGHPTPDPGEIGLLKAWLDAGLELANHTYSHTRFTEVSLEEFKKEILLGEQVTRPMMKEYGMELRWFRYPHLAIGDDGGKRAAFEEFLEEHGYIIAPVSVINQDWVYNGAYTRAWRAGDRDLMERIADDYIRYTGEVFEYVEQFSFDVLGYELPQILLLHANRLNADHFDRLIEMMTARGYQFISLEEALDGQIYESPDGLTETTLTTWLHRQWRAQGNERRRGPSRSELLESLRNR